MTFAPVVRIAALVRHDLRLQARDAAPLIVTVVTPLLIMAFMKPVFRAALVAEHGPAVNGAEQAVPGMAVMFSFFLVNHVGFSVFREHGWNTWERLRASTARPGEIMLSRIIVPLGVALIQLAVVFGIGGILFDLNVRGSLGALILVGAALALSMVLFGMALVAICRTVSQLNVFGNLAALVFAGLGGALTPLSMLPDWAEVVAPATPSYWAMRGFSAVVLDGAGIGAVALPAAVLLAFTAGFTVITLGYFRFDDRKVSWS